MGGLRHLRVGLDEAQRGHEVALDARQRLGRLTFEAQHQHRRGVGGADEAEAVLVVGAQAVDGDDLVGVGEARHLLQLLHQSLRLALLAGDVELRRAVAVGQGVEDAARVGGEAQDLQKARCRVGGIVEAVPALAEEDVAAHLARER